MADLAEGWGAVCKKAIVGANAQLGDIRANYLDYLSKRSKVVTPQEAFAELLTLTDRDLMSPDDIVLQNLTVTGKYQHSLTTKIDGSAGLQVPIGPANISLSGAYGTNQVDTSDLTLSATFGGRSRVQYLAQLVQSLSALQAVPVETGEESEVNAQPGKNNTSAKAGA